MTATMITETESAERRHKPRKKLNEIVYINLHPGNGGIVLDVSESGLSFHAAVPIDRERVPFRLSLKSLDAVEIVGKLAWKDETGKSGGLEFANLPDAVRNQILVWLDHPRFAPFHTQLALRSPEINENGGEIRRTIDPTPPLATPSVVSRGPNLRTKLFISAAVAAIGLNCLMALRIRHFVLDRANEELAAEMHRAMLASQAVLHENQTALGRKADLLSTLVAVTPDRNSAVQDAIDNPLLNDGSDLVIVADGNSQITAFQTSDWNMTAATAREMLLGSLRSGEGSDWWFVNGSLYQVVLQSVDHQPSAHNTSGIVVVGRRVDYNDVQDLAHILASQVAFTHAGKVIASTLSPLEEVGLSQKMQYKSAPQEIQIGQNHFLISSLKLAGSTGPIVGFTILKSHDETTIFVNRFNHLLVQLAEVEACVLIVFLIFTVSERRPITRDGLEVLRQSSNQANAGTETANSHADDAENTIRQ